MSSSPNSPNLNASFTPKGSPRTHRRQMKIERAVRLELAGYNDEQIAMSLAVTKVYISMLRRTPEYQSKRIEVSSGVISEEDRLLREDLTNSREELRSMVPNALLALRDSILDKNNPKLRFEAAKEILDREGTLGKVSKTEITRKDEFNFDAHKQVSFDLLAALTSVESSRSKLPESGTEDFVSAGGLKEDSATTLAKNIKLEDFELPQDGKLQ